MMVLEWTKACTVQLSYSVITNSSEQAFFVRYNQVNLCTKLIKLMEKSVCHNRVSMYSQTWVNDQLSTATTILKSHFQFLNIKLYINLNYDHPPTTATIFVSREGGRCTQVWLHFQYERQENTFPNIMGGNSEGSYNIDTNSQNGLYTDEKEDVTWKTLSKCINLRCMDAFTKLTKMNSQILVFLHNSNFTNGQAFESLSSS